MSVTIEQHPAPYNSAYDCIKFVLKTTDIGSGNISKTMHVMLYDENNIALWRRPAPCQVNISGGTYELDLSKDLYGLVFTSIPNTNIALPTADPNIVKGFYIKYGNIIIDKTSGNCVTIDEINQTSDMYYVVNGVAQEYERDQFNTNLPNILTHQPKVSYQCRNARNWTTILTNGTPINITYSASDGQTPVNVSTGTNRAYIIPLHPQNILPFWQQIEWMDVQIGSPFPEDEKFRIYFKDGCCCNEDYINIMYLDPLGGRGTISFDCVENKEINTSFTEVFRYRPCNVVGGTPDDVTRRTVGGRTILNKSGRESITLTKEIPRTSDGEEQLKAFLMSTGYHAQYELNGAVFFRKFIIESGSYGYTADEDRFILTIRGYFPHDYKTQKIDR